jgi:hypothetical protein
MSTIRLALGGIMSLLYRYKGYIFLSLGYKGTESRYRQHFPPPSHEATSDFQNNYASSMLLSFMIRLVPSSNVQASLNVLVIGRKCSMHSSIFKIHCNSHTSSNATQSIPLETVKDVLCREVVGTIIDDILAW